MPKQLQFTPLKINPAFTQLHLPIPEKARKALETTITKHGAIRPIKVWNGYIIDGHKHYQIYREKNIPYAIKEYAFNNRYEAMSWICMRNLLRFDLTEECRKYFIGKLYLLRYASAIEEGIIGHRAYATPGTMYNRHLISKDIGALYGISKTSVYTYGSYAEAIDKIKGKVPETASLILRGKVRISIENVEKISELPPEDLQILKEYFKKNTEERLSMPKIWHEIKWQRSHTPVSVKKKQEPEQAGIKKMPRYDPDAELSSLTLTIPMWKSSIERVKTTADFTQSSMRAKESLLSQLSNLSNTIIQLSSYIKETENDQQYRADSGSEQESIRTQRPLRADPDKEPGLKPGIPA